MTMASPTLAPRRATLSALAGLLPYVGAAAVAAPLALVAASLLAPPSASLAHIWATVGPVYAANTLALCALAGLGALAIGSLSAALVALFDFPGRRFLAIALALPLAVPAYVAAYAYGDLTSPFGALSEALGGPGRAPAVRNIWGAAFILTLATYPYVYLAVRASLEARSGALLEAARALGASPARAIAQTLAPAGRAAIAGGLALALMETAADYGVCEYFGVPSLSVGIFRTWRGLGDLAAALQLAAGLFAITLLLIVLEEAGRRGLAAEGPRVQRAPQRLRLAGPFAVLAPIGLSLAPALGFLIPCLTLIGKLPAAAPHPRLLDAAANTLGLGAIAAAAALAFATALAIAARRGTGAPGRLAIRVATLGYALPGAVVAIGVAAAAAALGAPSAVGLAGLAVLVWAYAARFATPAFNCVAAGLDQIHPSTDEAARALGAGGLRIAARIYWPAARPAMAAALLIVLIDVARELPATLILRPFNFETLATATYRLASDERLAEAAPAALALIAASVLPALLIERLSSGRLRRAAS